MGHDGDECRFSKEYVVDKKENRTFYFWVCVGIYFRLAYEHVDYFKQCGEFFVVLLLKYLYLEYIL